MKSLSIEDWLAELGSRNPVPGGGAVSALNGAIAAAQLKMVCEFTKEDKVKEKIGFLSDKVHSMLQLASADSEAFALVSAAYKTKDSSHINASLQNAFEVSVNIVNGCEELVKFCEENYLLFNMNLQSDTIVALANLRAAVQSAHAMEKTNLKAMKKGAPDEASFAIDLSGKLMDRIDRLNEKLGVIV